MRSKAGKQGQIPLEIYSDKALVRRVFHWLLSVVLASLIVSTLISLSNHDTLFATITGVSVLPILSSFFLVLRGKFEWAAIFVALVLTAVITIVATLGLGIHHISTMIYALILIVASLVVQRRTLTALTLITIGCVAWLVFGELFGIYHPKVLEQSVIGDFFTASLIITSTIIIVRVLTELLLKNHSQIEQELARRKTVEAKLRQSEERFRLAMDATQDGLWDWNFTTDEIYNSPVNWEMLGYEPGEKPANTLDWSDLIHPDDRPATLLANEDCFENRRDSFAVEFRMRAKNGDWRWLQRRGKVIGRDANGKVLRMIGTHTDITERKQAEQALQNSQRRLQALIENGLDYISLLDAEGKLIWESPSATGILGYRFNEFVGKSIFEVMHPDDLRWTTRQFAQVAGEPGGRQSGTFRLRRADGSWRWVEAIVSNFLHDPAVEAIVINYRDVTERKKAEEAAQLNETRYRQAIMGAGAVPYYRDYQNKPQSYTFMGEGILQLTGYSAEEITPEIFDDLERESLMRGSLTHLTPDEAGKLSEAGEITHWACDYRIQARDGQTKWVADSAIQIRDENNKRIGVIGILQDITDRKQAEEKLRASEAINQAVISNSPIGVSIRNRTGQLLYANEAWKKIWAIPEPDLTEDLTRARETLVFDSRDDYLQPYHEAIRKVYEEGGQLILPNLHPASHRRPGAAEWVSQYFYALYDDAGATEQVVILTEDITERKRAEEELKAAHKRFEDVLNSIDSLIYAIDMATYELLFINTYGREYWGEVEGRICWQVLQKGMNGPCEFCPNKKLLGQDGKPAGVVVWEFQNTVTHRWYECHDRAMYWPDGRLVRIEIATDITDRKEADVALRVSEQHFKTLVENTPDIIARFDKDLRHIFVNKAMETLAHRPPETLLGKSHREIGDLPVGQIELAEHIIRGIFETGQAAEFETSMPGPGGLIHLNSRGVPELDEQGMVKSALFIHRDITARKQVEEALKQSEKKYRTIIESSPIPYAINDDHQNVTFLNLAFIQTFGYVLEDIPTLTAWWSKAYPDAEYRQWVISTWQAHLEKAEREGVSFEPMEARIRCKDGGTRIVLASATSLLDPSSGMHLVILYDITERKQAEDKLRASEEKFSKAIFASPDSININRLHDGMYISINRGFTQLMGYTEADTIGKTSLEINIWKDTNDRDKLVEQVRNNGEVQNLEVRFRRKDGGTKYGLMSALLIDLDDVPHILSITRDIDDRKQAENIIHARLRISDYAMEHTLDELLQNALDELCAFTDSPIGFFHFVEPDQRTLSLQTWSTRTLKEMCTADGRGKHYNIDQAGVWADCVREGAPVIHNDYASLPHRKGLPEGHAPVIREMVFPILRDQKMIAIIGVGNKAQNYTENDIAYASRLADMIWDITARKRAENAEREQRTMAEALSSTAAALNSTLNFDEVLDRVMDNVGRVVQHDSVGILLLDETGQTAQVAGYRVTGDQPAAMKEFRFTVQETRNLREMQGTGASIIIADTGLYDGWIVAPSGAWIRSTLGVPIKVKGEIIGFLCLDSALPNTFTPQDAERLQAFVDYAAIAIENARLYEEVQKLAVTDTLTNIFNRTFFETELARLELSRDFPVSVVVADLDNMKKTNDTLGHVTGDELLKCTAQILQTVFRASDILARIGGDEFAILLPHTDATTMEQMLSRIQAKLAEHNVRHPALPVQLSLGSHTAEHGNLTEAFILADRRMYADKARRKSS